jgi:Uri superfamily endonuclease
MDTRSEAIPVGPGVYALWLVAGGPASIGVGKLGTVRVAPGRAYVYIGSALNGLARRIGRHLAVSGKKMHWHIDYLLEHLSIQAIYLALTTTSKECEISLAINALASHFTPIKGFGNSDCTTCPSHLYEGEVSDEPDSIDMMVRAAFRGSGLQPLTVPIATK